MASSVFYRFKSQKDLTKLTFDGTGISVFELKRDIIKHAGLGDGSSFDLMIYADPDCTQEYDDDTTIIPRASTVVARRAPPTRPGHGRAARYVSGKAPVTAKNAYRTEASRSQATGEKKEATASVAGINMAQTEEERIAAMFKAEDTQWEAQKQQMANAKPVYFGKYKGKQAAVPDHPPPASYICYRCHEKGHWIQECPTNDDPNFEAKPKIKRTTGIPKSQLKLIDKPVAAANDGLTDDRPPAGVMVDAQGNWVRYDPDDAAWAQYQAKAKAAKDQEAAVSTATKELQDRGLACPIDKSLFVNPVKTPCCDKTFCLECIENALSDSDLTCPECGTTDVLVEDLAADEEMKAKIKAYEDEKATEKKAAESLNASRPGTSHSTADVKPGPVDAPSPAQSAGSQSAATPGESSATANSNKRPAEEELKNDHIPTGPAAMRRTGSQQEQKAISNLTNEEFVKHMNALAGTSLPPNQQMPLATSNPPNMSEMSLSNPMMGMFMNPMTSGAPANMMNPMTSGPQANMMNPMMNPMMMMMQPNGGWNGNMNMGFPQQNGMYGNNNNFNAGMYNQQGGWPQQQNWQGNQGWGNQQMPNGMGQGGGFNGPQMNPGMGPGGGFNNQMNQGMGQGPGFANQQRTVFSQPLPNEESDAYMRRPVNPHRNQYRVWRARPSDYKELGS